MNLDGLKKSLVDLKNLNPKTPGAWPWPAKIIAFVAMFIAVVVAGALLLWQNEWGALTKVKQEEGQLKEAFLNKKEAGNQPGLDQETAYRNPGIIWRFAQAASKQIGNGCVIDGYQPGWPGTRVTVRSF